MFVPELSPAETIFEPFRIKMTEPLPLPTYAERKAAIEKAKLNLFLLPANQVSFDLLTDSGTGAMSSAQWAAMMIGDESYAGSDSFYRFQSSIQDLTGLEHVIPTHQGRAAEALFAKALLKPGMAVLGNTHFDTTRANIESAGARAIDLPSAEAEDSECDFAFKGNIDLRSLEAALRDANGKTPLVIMTVTNNSIGGQPVSYENIRRAKDIARSFGIPLFIDGARFAENAFFIQRREPAMRSLSVKAIAQKVFALADGVLMSAKKDAFGNIGGFLALRDQALADRVRTLMVVTEGFPTYGGLAGRDMDALAVGLREIVDEAYLAYRIRSVEYFGAGIEKAGYKVIKPFGGHAVYIDAGATLKHIPASQFPGQALSIALYQAIGIRSSEIGSVMLGRRDEATGQEFPRRKSCCAWRCLVEPTRKAMWITLWNRCGSWLPISENCAECA